MGSCAFWGRNHDQMRYRSRIFHRCSPVRNIDRLVDLFVFGSLYHTLYSVLASGHIWNWIFSGGHCSLCVFSSNIQPWIPKRTIGHRWTILDCEASHLCGMDIANLPGSRSVLSVMAHACCTFSGVCQF